MRLWYLRWKGHRGGFVVRAETEAVARRLIHADAEGANADNHDAHDIVWLNPKMATCVELVGDGPVEVIP